MGFGIKNNPVFSIVTPAYNRGKEIKRAFASVASQTFEDFEWVVVDDGSTDNTREAVESFNDHRIVFDFLPKNRGVNAARNRALDLAKGEYLVFLDSDDELLPDALEIFFNIWEKNKDENVGCFFTRCLDGKTRKKVGAVQGPDMVLDYKDIICGKKLRGEFHSCWKREAIGEERFSEDIIGCEAVLWWRIHKKWEARFMDVPTRVYNKSDGLSSVGSLIRNAGKMTAGYEILIKEHKSALIEYCPENFVHYSQALAIRYMMSGESGKARGVLQAVFKIFPFSISSSAIYALSFFGKSVAISVFKIRSIF
ncbi:MAG: glycosyltransferase family A protein [Candidatus Paceibacterota bacterium]|jgi:glycosyltransferase involved in cell wall biosynthesis